MAISRAARIALATIGASAVIVVAAGGAIAWRHYRPTWDATALREVAARQGLEPDAVERAADELIKGGGPAARIEGPRERWLLRVREGEPVAEMFGRVVMRDRGFRLLEQLGSGLTYTDDRTLQRWGSSRLTRHYDVVSSEDVAP